jgi:hypothetical protein
MSMVASFSVDGAKRVPAAHGLLGGQGMHRAIAVLIVLALLVTPVACRRQAPPPPSAAATPTAHP